MNFHSQPSGPLATAEHLPGQEAKTLSFTGIPLAKIERIQKERRMSPKSIRHKVNTFIEEVVMPSQEATALVFEELCKCLNHSG